MLHLLFEHFQGGDPTSALGSPLQCSTTLSVNNFFLISNLNLSSAASKPIYFSAQGRGTSAPDGNVGSPVLCLGVPWRSNTPFLPGQPHSHPFPVLPCPPHAKAPLQLRLSPGAGRSSADKWASPFAQPACPGLIRD